MIFNTVRLLAKKIKTAFSKYGILSVVLPLIFLITAIFNIFYIHFEQISLLDVLYFNMVTAATVGYGDVCPKTPEGRALTIIYIPMIVSLFAVVLGTIGAAVLDRIERKKFGLKKSHRNFDILILGGYTEKVDALVQSLRAHSKKLKICVMSKSYTRLPDFFVENRISWIDGNITDENALQLIDLERVNGVIVLSTNPVDKASDAKILNMYSMLRSASATLPILVETVRGDFSCFPNDDHVRYMQVSGAGIVAKEFLLSGSSSFFSALCNNNIPGDQANLTISEPSDWSEVCSMLRNNGATPLGYHEPASDVWQFFPKGNPEIHTETVVKYATVSDPVDSKPVMHSILLITNSAKRVQSFCEDFFADSRFARCTVTVLTNNDDTFGFEHPLVNIVVGDGTDERVLRAESLQLDSFEHVVIMADWGNPESDDHACLMFNIIRNHAPRARIVVEIVSSPLEQLYSKIYDNSDLTLFTGVSNTRVLVQEVQDFGLIELMQKINEVNSVIHFEERTIPSAPCSWAELQEKFQSEEGVYLVGMFDSEENLWSFDPDRYAALSGKASTVRCICFHK